MHQVNLTIVLHVGELNQRSAAPLTHTPSVWAVLPGLLFNWLPAAAD